MCVFKLLKNLKTGKGDTKRPEGIRKDFFEIFVGVGLIMFEHEKSGQVCRNSIDRQICSFDSMVEVIVFATPTVKAIGEPIDGLIVFPGERSNATYVVEVLETGKFKKGWLYLTY